MDMTWGGERPEAITTASHSEERPAKSTVTISSALSSSSEVLMRSSSADCGGGAFLALGLLGAAFWEGFAAGFLPGFLPVFLPGFFGAADFLTLALALVFLVFAGLRVSSSVASADLACLPERPHPRGAFGVPRPTQDQERGRGRQHV